MRKIKNLKRMERIRKIATRFRAIDPKSESIFAKDHAQNQHDVFARPAGRAGV
ncbi:hypothetical protein [Mesorhizobium atlanticum]|uniref:hypothetical protein n=1 Tax=Mesorhizobium atlanticum TaxID=2233532 RepID=UPI0015EC0872|nr:hypothetical protein [Mesorhizobium atlanticum]